jgi:hypothetical protein
MAVISSFLLILGDTHLLKLSMINDSELFNNRRINDNGVITLGFNILKYVINKILIEN